MIRRQLAVSEPVKLKTRPRKRTGRQPRSIPESQVHEAFMRVGDEIQRRHIEAFKRLADR